MNRAPTHLAYEGEATEVEQSVDFNVSLVSVLANDGDVPIIFNFDRSTLEASAMTLLPGEVLNNFPRKVRTLYVRASSGTQAFRAWGVS